MALNENIKSRRMQLKMSQEYVADQLGISRQAVAKWESGQSRPTSSNLTELAALFEMDVSELVDPQKWAEDKKEAETLKKDSQRNAKMHVGRVLSYLTINAGWDGYSSGLYSPVPLYWLAILAVGLILLFLTSIDMNKKCKLKGLQIAIGLVTIFSIFIMPDLIPVKNTGVLPDRAEPEILALYLEETTKLRAFLIAKHTEDYYAITIQQSKQKKLHRCLRRL